MSLAESTTTLTADAAEVFLGTMEAEAQQAPYYTEYELAPRQVLIVREDNAMRDRRVKDKSAVILPYWYTWTKSGAYSAEVRELNRAQALELLQGIEPAPMPVDNVFTRAAKHEAAIRRSDFR